MTTNAQYTFSLGQSSNSKAILFPETFQSTWSGDSGVVDSNSSLYRFDIENIFQILSRRMDGQIARSVSHSLLLRYKFKGTPISGLRPRVLHPPSEGSGSFWPVVQWVEDDDTDITAIFKVVNESAPCSYLMHCGIESWTLEGKRSKESFFECFVPSFDDLTELAQAGRDIFGILLWSNTDCVELHNERGIAEEEQESNTCRANVYRIDYHARLFASYIISFGRLGSSTEPASLDSMSPPEGVILNESIVDNSGLGP